MQQERRSPSGCCTYTSDGSADTIAASTLQTELNAGNFVNVTVNGSGSDPTINYLTWTAGNNISWTGAGILTMKSYGNITINSNLSSTNSSSEINLEQNGSGESSTTTTSGTGNLTAAFVLFNQPTVNYSGNIAVSNTMNLNSSSGTLSGVISGTGNLLLSGSDTWIFTGNNTYTGQTQILSGTNPAPILQIGNGGNTGALGTGDVVNGGALIFDLSRC